MLEYNEMLLMLHLEPLDRLAKTAFAAACAERMVPLSNRYARQTGDSLREQRLTAIVSAAWQAAAGGDVDATLLEAEAEAMVPDEDDEGWTAGRSYAGNAAAAAGYAIRTWRTNDPQHAAWAARQIFDAADLAYFQANPGGSFLTEAEQNASLESTVVQSAISAIHRDLEAVKNAWPLSELRQRAQQEGQEWAATVP
ncbi:DUF416 family protein [Arthrobacter sp. FW306-2-2C-D06B]|uniref:DUF416 family protein n=1 Tax=Arthrobacter sp. FW306-2-2C-D06B TaxID=2879618 RepID=UPI001F261A2B|nr:DUF416 family protein [Arthrobacter sp. FW306-2-2C-D06B]UKA56922.1 DUF416 family protein [Arthrobacter sp. FW306-2-2C-D06B]